MEEIKVRPDGVRLSRGPGAYKIPSADDAPRHFSVHLLKGSSNKNSIFSSKVITFSNCQLNAELKGQGKNEEQKSLFWIFTLPRR